MFNDFFVYKEIKTILYFSFVFLAIFYTFSAPYFLRIIKKRELVSGSGLLEMSPVRVGGPVK
jgi:hypothetical protein